MIFFNHLGRQFGDFDEWKPPFELARTLGGWQTQAPNHPALPLRVSVVEDVYDTTSTEPATREEVLSDPFARSGTWENPPSIVLNLMISSKIELNLLWNSQIYSGILGREIAVGNHATKVIDPTKEDLQSEHYVDGWFEFNHEPIEEGHSYLPTDPKQRFLRYAANTYDPDAIGSKKKPVERRHDGSQEWLRRSHPAQPLGNADGSSPDIAGIRLERSGTSYVRLDESRVVDEGEVITEEFTETILDPFPQGDYDGEEPPEPIELEFKWVVSETKGIKNSRAEVFFTDAVYISSLKVWLIGLGGEISQGRYHLYGTDLDDQLDLSNPNEGGSYIWGPEVDRDEFPEGNYWDVLIPIRNEQYRQYLSFQSAADAYKRNLITAVGTSRWRSTPSVISPDSSTEYNAMQIEGSVKIIERYPLFPK